MYRHISKMYDVLSETENIIFITCVVIYLTLTAKLIFYQTYNWVMISGLASAIFIGGHIGYQKYLRMCKLDMMCNKVRPILHDCICELENLISKSKSN